MRWPLYLLLVLAAWASIGVAQDAAALKAIGSLPSCAQLCLATAVVDSPCQLSDKQCVCANAELQSAAEKCVISSCTIRESLTTKNVTSALCDVPVRSEITHLRVANIVLAVVTGSCIILRFSYHMFFHVNGLNWDDFLVLATVVLAVPSVVIVDRCMLPNGIGIDIWNVPFDHIDNFIRWLYVVTLLYLLQAALVKITLLSFFLRIFLRRRTVQLLWGTIIFIGLWTFSIFIPAAMPCLPVSDFWTGWDMERPTKCLNMDAVVWMHAIIGIVLDLWMIAIPLYEVYHLQMTWVKKFGVALMFSLGTFVTVVSILRLKSLFFFDGDNNYTWKQAKVVLWSMYELHVGVICACIPTLRLIFIRAIPSVISSIQGSTQRSSANGNGSRRSRGTTQNLDTLRSDRGGKEGLAVEPNTITYTRTFAVRHEENDEEVELVHMEDLSEKTSRERGGSYASELSL